MLLLKPGGKLFAAVTTRFAPFRYLASAEPAWLADHPAGGRQVIETGIHHQPAQFAKPCYAHPDEVLPLIEACGLRTLKLVGCESVVAGHEACVNERTGEAWEGCVDLHYALGQELSLRSLGPSAVCGEKRKRCTRKDRKQIIGGRSIRGDTEIMSHRLPGEGVHYATSGIWRAADTRFARS